MHPPGNKSGLYVSVYITTSTQDEARTIGATLVEERLAACANIIGNVESIYWWEGKVETAPESILFLKTRKDLAKKLIERATELHSYDVPAVLVLPIIDGNMDYLRWLEDEVGQP